MASFLDNLGYFAKGVQSSFNPPKAPTPAPQYFNGNSWKPQYTGNAGQAMTQQSYQQSYPNPIAYVAPKPTVINTGGSSAPSTNTATSTNSSFNQNVQNVQDQGNQAMDLINQDYENAMGAIGSQESTLRGDVGYATGQAEQSGQTLKNSYAEQATTQEAGVNSQVSTAEKGATTAMQQARDLFRQTQNSNNAQLSALGISSSSVSEALAERLGVETARRIAGVTGSLQEVRQNATTELKNIKDYVAKRNTEITQGVENEKGNIQRQFLSAMDQLNNSRNVAATERARGRANIMSQVQNSISSLNQQAQQWQQQLDAWQKQQSSNIYSSVGDFEKSVTSNLNTANSQWAPSGFQYAPEFSVNTNGQPGAVKYSLQKKTQVDENGNPINPSLSSLAAPTW